MFIVRVSNSRRNGTYPLMFIPYLSNSRRNGTYPLLFIVSGILTVGGMEHTS